MSYFIKYISSSYNSIAKSQATWLKDEQKTWTDIFKRRYTDGKQAHEKMLSITNLRNANQNNRDSTSHLSEWLSGKYLQIVNAGKDEKGTLLHCW